MSVVVAKTIFVAELCNKVLKGRLWWKNGSSEPSGKNKTLLVISKTYFSKILRMLPIHSHYIFHVPQKRHILNILEALTDKIS